MTGFIALAIMAVAAGAYAVIWIVRWLWLFATTDPEGGWS
jgi:hypothetical protein